MQHRVTYLLPLILGLFLLLALGGVFYNYPLTDAIGDETVLLAASLKMIAEPSLRPDFPTNYHMPLATYLYLPVLVPVLFFLLFSGLFTDVSSLVQFGVLEYGRLLPVARGISILLALASIYLLYRICRTLFNDRAVGLVAAFLLATDALFVFLAHFGKVWIPQIFVVLLALFFIVKVYRAPAARFRDYALVGALIAAAFATHVVGVLVYLPFLVVHYYKHAGKKLTHIFFAHRHFIFSHLVIAAGVALAYALNPYGFENYFGQGATATARLAGSATAGGERSLLAGFFFYARVLVEYAPLLLILFFFGAYRLFRRAREAFWIFISFAAGYYVAIGPVLGSTHAIPHYISPIIPALAAPAAYGAVAFFREHIAARSGALRAAVIIVFVSASVYLPLLFDYRLMQQTTAQAFMRWLPAHIPAGARIVSFNPLLPIPENRASIEVTKEHNPSFLLRRQAYLLTLPDEEYPAPSYFLFQPALYAGALPVEIDRRQFAYAVLSWDDAESYTDIMSRAREYGVTEERRIAVFPDGATKDTKSGDPESIRNPLGNLPRMTHAGPVIGVYKLK